MINKYVLCLGWVGNSFVVDNGIQFVYQTWYIVCLSSLTLLLTQCIDVRVAEPNMYDGKGLDTIVNDKFVCIVWGMIW